MEEIPLAKPAPRPKVSQSVQKGSEKKRKADEPPPDPRPTTTPAEGGKKSREDRKKDAQQEGQASERGKIREGRSRAKERDYKGLGDYKSSDDETRKKRGSC